MNHEFQEATSFFDNLRDATHRANLDLQKMDEKIRKTKIEKDAKEVDVASMSQYLVEVCNGLSQYLVEVCHGESVGTLLVWVSFPGVRWEKDDRAGMVVFADNDDDDTVHL